jgi:prepilin-type N-terminal cleavage/methylation domain-containing protein
MKVVIYKEDSKMLPLNKNSKKGFSIVELIIALAITSIALIAIYNLFISQQRSFMVQEEVANMQQNNRVAMEDLAVVVKMAGAGVLPPQNKIIYCGPYDFVYAGNINGIAGDVMSMGATAAGGAYVAPDPSVYANQDCESYRWTLDKNDDGDLTAADLTNTTAGADQYSLWQITYTGNTSVIDEVSPNISINDINGNQVIMFKYWGFFDADPNLDLYGDTNEDGILDAGEINTLLAAPDPGVTDLTGTGRALDDMLQRVDIAVINETHRKDPNYPSNDGFRQTANSSTVTPRNLWACSIIETVPGYQNTLMVVMDNTASAVYGGPDNIKFKVTESTIPVSGMNVKFSATIEGVDITLLGGTLSKPNDSTDANGIVSVDVGVPGCSPNFPLGKQIIVTATIPAIVTPFGPCAADFDIATITLVPGPPNHTTVISAPTDLTLFTCGEAATISSLTIEIRDACDNPVPPDPPNSVNFGAFKIKNGICVGPPSNPNFGSISWTWPTPETAIIKYASKVTGPYDADRTGPGLDQFAVPIVDDLTGGAFNCGAPLVTLFVETFPDKLIGFDPLNNDITNTDHTDCNAPGTPSSTATFQIEDSCGNLVYDVENSSKLQQGSVTATFAPDTSGVLNNPDDQGYIDPAPTSILNASGPPTGDYTITYTEPYCTLPPLYTKILNPTITLTGNNFRTPFTPIPFSLDLHSCTDCEVTTSNPIMLNCQTTDATASIIDVPGITVVFCGIADGTPVELEVTSSAGAGGNASFDPTNPNVTTVSSVFTNDIFTANLYPGNAPNLATFTVTAYSPSKATYMTDPGGFMCEAIDLVTLQSHCASIKTFNQQIVTGAPESTSISAYENLYIEVEDCNQNKDSSAYDTITVTVTSPQGYTPPNPDIETVILTEDGLDTGIFNNNNYVGAANDPGPLPIMYCGLGSSGDVSQNGRLFVRAGFDVTVQYIDPDDPTDNACSKTLSVNQYTCKAFVYSYYAQAYIHLDRHNINAPLTLGGNIFTNGEFELAGNMFVDGRGPDGIIHTPDDYETTSLGHMSIAGNILGDIFAPSFDLHGPDGQGQNTQSLTPNNGELIGNAYLMDGFRFDDVTSTYYPEVVGSRGNPPSYGSYTSLAATGGFMRPPGSAVVAYSLTGGQNFVGTVYPMPFEPGYPFDPNANAAWTLPYSQGGKVLLAKEIPEFDYSMSIQYAQDMSSRYHSTLGEDTYFVTLADFEAFIKTPRTYTALDGTTYTSPRVNPQNKVIYIIGDPYEGTTFHVTEAFDVKNMNFGSDQLLVHGMITTESYFSTQGSHGGMAFYGCGTRPIEWIDGFTGSTCSNYSNMSNSRGGEEPIPYDTVAMVSKGFTLIRDDATGSKGHVVVKGIAYSEEESHIHNDNAAGKAFIIGAQIADVIHNCAYVDFTYNDCVKRAAAIWYGCPCDTGGAAVTCSVIATPSSSIVTKGGSTQQITASGGQIGAYTYTVTGSSGGSVDPTGLYTSGPNIGVDVVTVSEPGCLDAKAVMNVVATCDVKLSATNISIPLSGSYIFTATSALGGPFNWSFIQNQSGGTLSAPVGTAITYTAGALGGEDIILVTDDAGCGQSTINIFVDTCTVLVDIYEYSGVGCTANAVDTVSAGGEVCVAALLGDPASQGFVWSTTDPNGMFYDPFTATWVGSGVMSSQLGDTVRYRSGLDLGTYTLTATDDEGCSGNHFVSTCAITVEPTLGPALTNIYTPMTIEFTGWVGPAVPIRNVASWSTTDTGATLVVKTPTTADYTPSGTPGTYEISIEDNVGCTATFSITVDACPPIKLLPSNPDVTLITGSTTTFSAIGGSGTYKWESGTPGYGTIDPDTGVFTPVAVGDTVITATDTVTGCTGTTIANVVCPSITVEPASASVLIGSGPYNYTASFGSPPYTWESTAPIVAAIASSGPDSAKVTIVGGGITSIVATDANGCKGVTSLAVVCPAVVTVTPDNPTMLVGDTVSMKVVGGVQPYTWTSSDPVVGTLVQTGPDSADFTASGVGISIVSATDSSGCQGTTTAIVQTGCLEQILVHTFDVNCSPMKSNINVRATSDKQPDALPLTFAIFDVFGNQIWPASGTQEMTWIDAQNEYRYNMNDAPGFGSVTWDSDFIYVEVYSQDCVTAPPGKRLISRKFCP